ncbi:MAG: deoxyhypusine synthase [Nitrosopumilaceae archaeon]|nr:deoxyhypusine synthase [Nitrosopumilaceae archaeon]NIT99754.1 deoxyhypusine synthase [Nitrosopumilaceae archaeon]NIU88616.1 deoxyhypusine synthase [Nitrosopumilaceae archaeon]NIV64890.1 deoxyhypusine synthase [Nitrosopumilaceae archaeon]NIX60357.1 deoxyhypusine synthase [Nitrosopumilaceae archaeon]
MIKPGRSIKDIKITDNMSIEKIFAQLATSGGFESINLSKGVDILSDMLMQKNCLRFLSFVGAIISTGARGIIKDMIKKKWFDVVITTCGALDHDIARYFSNYKEGDFTMDDKELAKGKVHRLGNVLVPMETYGPLIENKMQQFLEQEYKKGKREMSSEDVTRMIGSKMGESSFLHWAYKNKIPVIVPGILDGAVGSQLWLFAQSHPDFKLNLIADSEVLSGLIFKAKKSGALMIGGGISKHHTLWWNQYRDGLDYALYLTTAQEFDGSLSGALVREAISWGKVTRKAHQTTIHAEATTILPFIYATLLSKIKNRM